MKKREVKLHPKFSKNAAHKNLCTTTHRVNLLGIRGLNSLDEELSRLFVELDSTGDHLARLLEGTEISGDDILRSIESPDWANAFGRLSPFIRKCNQDLNSIRERLLVLLENKENTLNELASVLVVVCESGNISDQRSSVIILDSLLRWEGIDSAVFEKGDSFITVKFASLLRLVLTRNRERLALTAAARALGRLAKVSDSSSRGDFVRFETNSAIEWLHLDSHATRRLAAALILRYLTEMVPTLFVTHDHAASFFNRIGSALLDVSPQTRYAARDAMRALFLAVNTRVDQKLCFEKCYSIVVHGVSLWAWASCTTNEDVSI